MLSQHYRPYIRAAQGALAAFGAPLGWLIIRMLQGGDPYVELNTHVGLYLYMLLGTIGAFSLFGWYVGGKEGVAALQALRDALTGLYNVRFFRERLSEEVMTAHREQSSLMLISFDIDHFKNVNDTYGHPFGDDVIKAVGFAAASVLRKNEVLARVGGEEFSVLLPRCTVDVGKETAERIRQQIESTSVKVDKNTKVAVTVSVGLTSLSVLDDCNSFYERADSALYKAKREGRNRVVVE